MSRAFLAFICFFRILFGKKLPVDAVKFLPEEALPKALPGEVPTAKEPAKEPEKEPEKKPEKKPEAAAEKKPEAAAEKPPAERSAAEKPKASAAQHHKEGALALLALLQREGRLVDFLTESIDAAPDDAIGAAVREVHRGCRKVLDQYLPMEPVMPGEEGAKASVPKGFDPAEIRLIGEAKGEPPYRGTLRHHGWRVVDAKLPALADGVDRTVLAPAEVELSA
jgi:outer membrane biosynthesis protein TonB